MKKKTERERHSFEQRRKRIAKLVLHKPALLPNTGYAIEQRNSYKLASKL